MMILPNLKLELKCASLKKINRKGNFEVNFWTWLKSLMLYIHRERKRLCKVLINAIQTPTIFVFLHLATGQCQYMCLIK